MQRLAVVLKPALKLDHPVEGPAHVFDLGGGAERIMGHGHRPAVGQRLLDALRVRDGRVGVGSRFRDIARMVRGTRGAVGPSADNRA